MLFKMEALTLQIARWGISTPYLDCIHGFACTLLQIYAITFLLFLDNILVIEDKVRSPDIFSRNPHGVYASIVALIPA